MSFINKFGESSTPKYKFNDSKLRSNLLKMLDVEVNNHVFDIHKKRITNLATPIEPKDAVTKAYLKRTNELLTNKIDKTVKDVETKIQLLTNKINHAIVNNIEKLYKDVEVITTANKDFEKKISDLKNEINQAIVNNIEKFYKDVEAISIAIPNHIKKEENVIEQSVEKQILKVNKEYMKKVDERVNKVEEYILKLDGIDERFNNIEDYLFKNIDKRPPIKITKYP